MLLCFLPRGRLFKRPRRQAVVATGSTAALAGLSQRCVCADLQRGAFAFSKSVSQTRLKSRSGTSGARCAGKSDTTRFDRVEDAAGAYVRVLTHLGSPTLVPLASAFVG